MAETPGASAFLDGLASEDACKPANADQSKTLRQAQCKAAWDFWVDQKFCPARMQSWCEGKCRSEDEQEDCRETHSVELRQGCLEDALPGFREGCRPCEDMRLVNFHLAGPK